ncbi:MAG: hypothetical protein HOO99_15575 [Hyphomicrobiaceae bacterium]|nr:hypothetical protein [Hyphomicrobiaceae bacterium]
MSRLTLSHSHKSWEDWMMMALGGVLIVSMAWDPGVVSVWMAVNAIVVGFLVLTFAISEFELPERWVERVTFVLGLWAFLSPVLFGYFGFGTLWLVHMIIGAAVMAMAALELWQDDPTPRLPG